ncbi:MAG: hypothetical protein LBQ38_10210 [Spirochaetaceae bacterium]|jgi:hypothetical protein|nr:hypothetical protein [Spirochaetaceae bacterium]
MANKEKAVYAPGELSKVRDKLGTIDQEEAKRMAQILGGEVGVERIDEPDSSGKKHTVRNQTVEVKVGGRGSAGHASVGHGSTGQPMRRVEVSAAPDTRASRRKVSRKKKADPSDNPTVPIKLSYRERVRMDRYAGQSEFEIKTFGQVLQSILSIFREIPDGVSPVFVTRRLDEYYKRIEQAVTATRILLPRNNLPRNERLKKSSPTAFSILDTIRHWNVEGFNTDLSTIQSRPRSVLVGDLAEILKIIYKPLFILERLDFDAHIKESYKLLYKIVYLENPTDTKDKNQELIRTAIGAISLIRRDVRFLLYPLLLKILSDRWLPYEAFFRERRRRFMAFLNVTERDQIVPVEVVRQVTNGKNGGDQQEGADGDSEDPEVVERKARQMAIEAEKKAVDRGITTLETLFPRAGWDRLSEFPDMYPYFLDVFSLKRDYALIAPSDPMLQIGILMRILEELFFGLRYVSFGAISGPDGTPDRIDDTLGPIINNWQYYLGNSFDKEYFPRLSEYCRILETTSESRTSSYAKRLVNELHWIKRLYFLPYYKFESTFPPPFQKKDVTPLYPEIRQLRKYLTAVAAGIEQGTRQGGAELKAPCEGIDNPWEPYIFQVPNPLSIRLDALLGEKKRNNASLIFFTLAVTVLLDYLINNDGSWAYGDRPGPLFRSTDGERVTPLPGDDSDINSEALFKQSIKQRDRSNKEEEQAPDQVQTPDQAQAPDQAQTPDQAHVPAQTPDQTQAPDQAQPSDQAEVQ